MAYRVRVLKRAQKQLDKMEPRVRRLIASYINQTLNGCENPRTVPDSKSLRNVENGWRWRVGAYRILGVILDDEIVIEIIRVGHRRDVYDNL